MDGTSMAAPHVAGAAAKIWAARPGCTNEQIREALFNTVLDLGDEGRDDKYGYGLVQTVDAYKYLLREFEEPCGEGSTTAFFPSCKMNFESCTTDSECCSNTCRLVSLTDNRSICRSAAKAVKTKIGGGSQGGAAGGHRKRRKLLRGEKKSRSGSQVF